MLFAAGLLCACATVETEAPPLQTQATADTLPAQVLAAGECGLFGYTTEATPRFIFFAASDGRGLYQAPDGSRVLEADAGFPATNYDGGRVQLDLGEPETLIDGQRYNGARLVETLDDGFERVRPLVVLESCG